MCGSLPRKKEGKKGRRDGPRRFEKRKKTIEREREREREKT